MWLTQNINVERNEDRVHEENTQVQFHRCVVPKYWSGLLRVSLDNF